MAKIIINGVTHREAALAGYSEEDCSAYDERIGEYLEWLGAKVKTAGFEFEVDDNGNGGASYRVAAESYEEAEAAHDLMQSTPDFWAWF